MSFQQSESIAKLSAALLQFQSYGLKILKEDVGQIGQKKDYKYANLETVWDAIRAQLTESRLAIVQFPGMTTIHESSEYKEDKEGVAGRNFTRLLELTTQLVHAESGEWMRGTSSFPVGDPAGINAAQASGLVTTYMRRYAILAILGLATTDDDAQGAWPSEQQQNRPKPYSRPNPANKDVIAPTTKPWQELFEKGAEEKGPWADFTAPDSPDLLGTMKFDELRPFIEANVRDGGLNPAITAANAFFLEKAARQRKMSVVEALDKIGGDHPALLKMDAKAIYTAFRAVCALPK